MVLHFRSPNEFVFHAKWLAFNCPMTEDGGRNCECTYCSGTPQKVLAKELKAWSMGSSTSDSQRESRRGAQIQRTSQDSRDLSQGILVKDYTRVNEGIIGVEEWSA